MTGVRSALGLALAGMLMTSAAAYAQTSGTAPPDRKPPDQNEPGHFDSQGRKQTDQTLSERLDRTDGVIKPPVHVDRDMVQQPPPSADGEMVIKPPVAEGQKPAPK
jgi:hypothetical protein